MNCLEIQENLLESFERLLVPEEKSRLEEHFSKCPECARFAAEHARLDLLLTECIKAPHLGPAFRTGLRARMTQQQREQWPEWLPDAAYLGGAGLAIGSCAFLLPLPSSVVLKIGVSVAFLAYSLQTLLISLLEPKTD